MWGGVIIKKSNKLIPIQEVSFSNHNQAYVIEASAGTGKTWTVERLFIKALLTRTDLSLEQFLVVTFTTNAVIELKTRILCYIYETIDNLIAIKHNTPYDVNDIFIQQILLHSDDNFDQSLAILTRAVQNFDFASIYTIHGFCNKILKNYQLECNINYPFTLVSSKKPLITSLIRNFFREKIINNPIFVNDIETVYKTLERVLGVRYDSEIIESIAKKLPITKRFFVYNNNEHQVIYKALNNPDLSILLLEDNASNDDILNNLLSGVINYINTHYIKYTKNINQLDYDSLISIVASSVKHNKDLATKIFKDYPIAFIDEFQDTDDLQWQIFSEIYQMSTESQLQSKQLRGNVLQSNELRGNALRGNVVVVGDPKQAIYRFRGADINVYLAAKNSIDNRLTLSDNHRQHKDIVNFINCLFMSHNNLFCFGENIDYQEVEAKVAQNKLISLPSQDVLQNILLNSGVNSKIYDTPVQIIAITGNTASIKQEKLYQAITFEILALLKSDATLVSKIAILVTKNYEAVEVVRQLNNYGIKASLHKRSNIFTTTTARDLLQILQAVFDISNFSLMQKALATNLFNIPYSQLNDFVQNSYYLPNGENIQQRFFIYKEALNKGGVISLIYALIRDLEMIATHNQSGLTNREVSNLMQLGELLHKYNLNLNNYSELLYWFKQKILAAIQDEAIEVELDGKDEELVRLDNDEAQIKVMTQHKSKGLEFDILFCPFFSKNNQPPKGDQLDDLLQFVKYRNEDNVEEYCLTTDKLIIQKMLDEENSEINRLNYVALTRAKSRIYIYLNEVKKSSKGYYKSSRPEKIHELFGFISTNNKDVTHSLFNYPQIFTDPQNSIKDMSTLAGVSIYLRDDITNADLIKLSQPKLAFSLNIHDAHASPKTSDIAYIPYTKKLEVDFFRQSYSSLTHSNVNEENSNIYDYFDSASNITLVSASNQEVTPHTKLVSVSYKYEILNQLRGAKFGVLVHSLCENYPLTESLTKQILLESNVDPSLCEEFMLIIDEIFNYRLFGDKVSLNTLENKLSELEFTLSIRNSVSIAQDIQRIIAKHYGELHPFTIESGNLNKINQGFLTGFIDLFFEYNGKYYVLDYKTNSLESYTSCADTTLIDNPLLQETASSHYYLQYLLYLVALKRYLEFKLKIEDASSLLGGSLYYYVRGIFVTNDVQGGVFIDAHCQTIVAELDELFK